MCYLSAAAHDWSFLPNNVTSCNSFYCFNNCAKSFIAECIKKTLVTHLLKFLTSSLIILSVFHILLVFLFSIYLFIIYLNCFVRF